MATNGNFAQQELQSAHGQPISSGADASATYPDIKKDEVGWYFVEQYYTTLSRAPEKLHLFYSKPSQFVYGLEADRANVSVGRKAIQATIKDLDFQEIKVRVTNVDSQATGNENIVIQVIGETSNKGAEPKKFVQTFVLARQKTGYYVLNDILRWFNDEEHEEEADIESPEAEHAPTTESAVAAAEEPQQQDAQAFEPVATPVEVREPVPTAAEPELVKEDQEQPGLDANAVDEKLTQAAPPKATESVNGGLDEPHSQSAEAIKLDPSNGSQDTAVPVENVAEPDKSQESSPAAVAKPKQEAAPEPVLPPKPMTWASRAAAAAGPRPVVPLPKTATSPAQSQNRAAAANSVAGGPAAAAAGPSPAVASSSAPTASPTIAPSAAATSVPPTAASQNAAPAATSAPAPDTPVKESSGWQTAGGDSKRQNRPQSMSAPHATEKEGTLVYVRFVTSKVQEADLRSVLAAYGELVYFDINRQKNCAFAEYKTVEAFQAAIAASPQTVNGVEIVTEPRRPKGFTYERRVHDTGRTNASGNRGRGGFDGNRNGQGSQRGNYSGQRGGATRGRGGGSTRAME